MRMEYFSCTGHYNKLYLFKYMYYECLQVNSMLHHWSGIEMVNRYFWWVKMICVFVTYKNSDPHMAKLSIPLGSLPKLTINSPYCNQKLGKYPSHDHAYRWWCGFNENTFDLWYSFRVFMPEIIFPHSSNQPIIAVHFPLLLSVVVSDLWQFEYPLSNSYTSGCNVFIIVSHIRLCWQHVKEDSRNVIYKTVKMTIYVHISNTNHSVR